MKVFTEKQPLKAHLSNKKIENKSIGFVPTMGALHKGHLSLIEEAKKKNDLVVVSIFVNPTQFDKEEDLVNYPKTFDKDKQMLESIDCDALFYPSVNEIYNNNISSDSFDFDGLEFKMEGKFRDGHFNGVGTIVKTLFEIVNPDVAYFGQKDFQQLQIIKKMVKKHNLKLKIKGCPIYREDDGLAMSSRNVRLNPSLREAAPFIYKTLKKARKKFKTKSAEKVVYWVEKEFKEHPLLKLEYFTIAEEKTLETIITKESDKKYRAFIAVFAGDIRLIDNIKLKQS
ncbi:pantoate--beta-alanine ligase [Polaribacter sp. MED152]|uniref:pantoate--beta-alanine ligase n=1 Tax=Polaribacter sp. MED152 TaxID=313598 RepID=UPI000068C98E|nr:pantoate--beta-alanine ligase [Polaribacter sp. MED152]EAQ42694.1 pantoate-beta-alanine ligase [Polaribacter sp. MED152]